jgi:hypothetical protein
LRETSIQSECKATYVRHPAPRLRAMLSLINKFLIFLSTFSIFYAHNVNEQSA